MPVGLTARRAAFGVLGAVATATVTAPARAERPAIETSYEAPPGCPDREAFVAELDRALDARIDVDDPRPMRVDATFTEPSPGTFSVDLVTQLDDHPRTRNLVAPSCPELVEAAALVVAVAYDDAQRAAASAASPPRPAPDVARAVTVQVQPAATALPADRGPTASRPEATPWGVELFGAFGVLVGALPAAAPSGELSAGLRYGRLRVEGMGGYSPPQRTYLAGESGVGADLGLVRGATRACIAALDAVVALGPCAGLEVGSTFGEGVGIDRPASGTALWLAARADLFATFHVAGPLEARLEAGAFLPLARDRFVLDEIGPVHQPGSVGGRASAGLGVGIP